MQKELPALENDIQLIKAQCNAHVVTQKRRAKVTEIKM